MGLNYSSIKCLTHHSYLLVEPPRQQKHMGIIYNFPNAFNLTYFCLNFLIEFRSFSLINTVLLTACEKRTGRAVFVSSILNWLRETNKVVSAADIVLYINNERTPFVQSIMPQEKSRRNPSNLFPINFKTIQNHILHFVL